MNEPIAAAEVTSIRSHGRTGYNKGCRCDVCRAAMARDARKAYAARKDRPVPEQVEHGKSRYANWGCRCEVCTAAATEANRSAARRYASTHREEINARRRAWRERWAALREAGYGSAEARRIYTSAAATVEALAARADGKR